MTVIKRIGKWEFLDVHLDYDPSPIKITHACETENEKRWAALWSYDNNFHCPLCDARSTEEETKLIYQILNLFNCAPVNNKRDRVEYLLFDSKSIRK